MFPFAYASKFTGIVYSDRRYWKGCTFLLKLHTFPRIAEHSIIVGYEAKRLARKFELDEDLAAILGFLHDIGVVFPNNKRIKVAK